jgi:uncharacterized membrane protein
MVRLVDHGWNSGMTTLSTTVTTLAALGSATFGGITFAFSGFVMRALDQVPARTAVVTMQHINLAAPRAPLVSVMVGTSLLCVGVGGMAMRDLVRGDAGPGPWLALAGSAAFLASIAITGGYHIPHNDAFAGVAPDGGGAAAAWQSYADPWLQWNHARTASALIGAGLLFVSKLV